MGDDGGLPAEISHAAAQWAQWVRTRKYYGPSPKLESTIGKLRTASSTVREVPHIPAGGLPAHWHKRVLSLPERDRLVLEALYVYRVRPVRQVADALRISRKQVYVIRNRAARMVFKA